MNNLQRKGFYFLAAIILISSAFISCGKPDAEKEKSSITMVANSLKSMNLRMMGTDTLTIDWGDGTVPEISILSDTAKKPYSHDYILDKIYTITITGNVSYLSSTYNNLTKLEVNKCPTLKEIYCGNNRLEDLDVSKCAALKFLDCSDNRFSVAKLNELFGTLNNTSGYKTIEIFSNSGCDGCDRSIAEKKGWMVSECW
jgi:hypothetical protein